MSKAQSKSKKKYWSGIDPSKRSDNSRRLANIKWSKTSIKDRKKHSDKMLLAKKNKNI